MHAITTKLYQVEGLLSGQVYFIQDSNGATLIDTGTLMAYGKIKKELNRMGLDLAAIKHVILTHNHMDHIANVKRIADVTEAHFYIHTLDAPAIKDVHSSRITLLNHLDKIPLMGGLLVIHIGGHTPGNIALYNEESKVLISGDNVFNDRNKPKVSPRIFNKDTQALADHYDRLLAYDVEIICPGHGKAILNDGNTILKKLSQSF